MPLRDIDRSLIDRCLRKEPGAWNDFVDRYMGLIYHVIQHAAHARSRVLSSEDIEDIAAEILLKIVDGDYGILRRFKQTSSLPTYLTVIARRICVKELVRRHREEELGHTSAHRAAVDNGAGDEVEAIVSAEEVERMLEDLTPARRRSFGSTISNIRITGRSARSSASRRIRSDRSWPRPGSGCGRPPNSVAPVERRPG